MAMYSTVPDEGVRAQMELHFGIITGLVPPTPKGEGADFEGWKKEFSFINVMAFRNAFMEAKARGLCSPAEVIAGDEIMEIIG